MARTQAVKAFKNKDFILDDSCNYVFYEQVKSYDLLNQIPKDNLIYFCNQKIWEIYEYDKAYKTNYLNTLHIYLQTNRSIKLTSNYLYLHRNTINYRILKIKELFRINLENDIMLGQFLLSCQIIQML
ncbi:MAG: helix-turn-helix domain-containing protein [Bacillota bacterium]|nr:helix-turn-helix domain-containing protein [Bacillota bacterium]